MSRAHDLAWCAGFFDGEGFVTIQKRNSKAPSGKRYESFYLRIGINHVAPEPLYEIQRILGGTLRKQSEGSVVGNRHLRTRWQMSCQQAANALTQMMPYFRNKTKAAEIGLALQNTMQARGKKQSEEEFQYRKSLQLSLQALNKQD